MLEEKMAINYWENISSLITEKDKLTKEEIDILLKYLDEPNNTEFYFNIIFPIVQRLFKAKVEIELKKNKSDVANKLTEASKFLPDIKTFVNKYDCMFYTVGTSIEPIVLSLTITQPEKIIFIATEETKGEITNIVKYYHSIAEKHSLKKYKEDGGKNVKYEILEVDRYDDSDIKTKVENKIDELKKNTDLLKIAFDLTGGKKSIVNTLYTVAALRNIDVFYVDFGWYERGNPVPGTEFLRLQKNPIEDFIDGLSKVFNGLKNGSMDYDDLEQNHKRLANQLIELGLLKRLNAANVEKITGMHQQSISE